MDLVPYSNDNILEVFPPPLQNNFKELFCNGKPGLCPVLQNDISCTKLYTENNSSYGYDYTLRIPYAGKRLNWELIFNPSNISFAPDFNFNDDTFHMSTDIDTIVKDIPSLGNWNVSNPKSLLLVLTEFLDLYKKHHLQKLHEEQIYVQLNSEYQALIEEVSPDDIEIYLDASCAYFLINIKVDVSALPEYLQPIKNGYDDEVLNPCDDACILKITFLKLDGSRVNSSLQLSPRLDQVLGNAKSLHIPKYLKSNSLANYVNSISQMLQDHIIKIQEHHKLKKEYITYLCTLYAENMTEYDSETFSMGAFLCEVDGYECLVTIKLNDLFPEEQPTVTLHSLCCIPAKEICSERVCNYSYNPRWSVNIMLKQLTMSLAETIPKFKNHKHN